LKTYELSDGLTAAQPDLEVVRIGDALAPRNLLDAAAEGARAGAAWPRPDLPAEEPATLSAG
jgi:dimethylglycine catabolism A